MNPLKITFKMIRIKIVSFYPFSNKQNQDFIYNTIKHVSYIFRVKQTLSLAFADNQTGSYIKFVSFVMLKKKGILNYYHTQIIFNMMTGSGKDSSTFF